eukprot:scaffold1695_cov167-Amphora_coffeaeformis.AAC.28
MAVDGGKSTNSRATIPTSQSISATSKHLPSPKHRLVVSGADNSAKTKSPSSEDQQSPRAEEKPSLHRCGGVSEHWNNRLNGKSMTTEKRLPTGLWATSDIKQPQ